MIYGVLLIRYVHMTMPKDSKYIVIWSEYPTFSQDISYISNAKRLTAKLSKHRSWAFSYSVCGVLEEVAD